jgi:hypothetical protein
MPFEYKISTALNLTEQEQVFLELCQKHPEVRIGEKQDVRK